MANNKAIPNRERQLGGSLRAPVRLKLNGQPFNRCPPSKALLKIAEHLDSCPADEIFYSTDVCRKLGLEGKYVCRTDRIQFLAKYTAHIGQRRYLGHPSAIAELKRQTGVK